jgi:two-component system OmpR family sensor kinase
MAITGASTASSSTLYVQLAQPLAIRNKLAAEMACVPARRCWCLRWCWALLVVVVGRALRPLDRLAQAVEGRSASALEPLSTGIVPRAKAGGVGAELPDAKVRGGADRAAHLRGRRRARTAFAADRLKLQLQLVERATDEARALALAKLDERLDRTTHLVRQL